MVDEIINRQGSMDVVLSGQEQLVSRIALAFKDSNKMAFLHGISGAGKSHIASRLQDSLSSSLVIDMSLRTAIEPDQLKQQLMCELVTDELTDLNQPIAKAVYQAVEYHNQSVLLIIDNAEFIANQGLSALWQSIHEFSRVNQSNFTFNVLLIGDTAWAKPLHHGLKSKSDSRVSEYIVPALTKVQATDFMMSIHADWSDQKIRQFLNKIPPQYMIPKQLIYAQIPASNRVKFKVFLSLGGLLAILVIAAVAVALYLRNGSEDSVTDIQEVPEALFKSDSQVGASTTPVKPDIKPLTSLEAISQSNTEQSNEPDISLSQQDIIELAQPAEQILNLESDNITDPVAESQAINPELTIEQPLIDATPDVITQLNSLVTSQHEVTYPYDEQDLLKIDSSKFSLMLGGFSQFDSLESVKSTMGVSDKVKIYQTIRDSKPWFVLLYGDFSTRVEASNYVHRNVQIFGDMAPWAKPFQSIHAEINATTRQVENDNNDNN